MHHAAARVRLLVTAAAVAAAMAACGSDALPSSAASTGAGAAAGTASSAAAAAACPAASPGATSDSFADPVSLTTSSDGLQVGDITPGSGAQPHAGQNLTVQYTGWLSNGTLFDSSRSAGRTPFSFVIGATPPNVIQGWEEGILTMHVGGKRRLVIPPALAYGAQAQGCIPANATLTFDVELLSAGSASPSPS